jgi:hypothetical protein
MKEFLMLLVRKSEVAIDIAATEAQVEDVIPGIICR